MPQERLSMRKIREVLRLRWQCKLSQRQIAQSCRVGQATVGDYLRRASEAGLNWPLPAELTDAELEDKLFPATPLNRALAEVVRPERPLPDWAEIHRELRKKGVTLQLLWEEYQRSQPGGLRYSWFCEQYQRWRQACPEPRMHQEHRAGDKAFVDYAGLTVPIGDRSPSGVVRQAQIFVATLGASSYTFAEATWTQTLPDWIASHVRAFAFFGGVPAAVVPDNLKSGVRSACYYDPDLNPTYHELARYYGTAILPARVRHPRDKGKVEAGVQQVENRVLAPLRHVTFFALADLNAALAPLVAALNDRPCPQLPGSRRELWETLDRPALQSLPATPYEVADWKKARVHLDYHVQVDFHFYSVPYGLVREEVLVRLTGTIVEVFHRERRVASHLRSQKRFGYTTLPEHMPPSHLFYAQRGSERFLRQARVIGTATEEWCRQQLTRRAHPEQGYRGCQGVLRLAEAQGAAAVERACARAVRAGSYSYRTLEALLREPPAETLVLDTPPAAPLQHANIRGASYYQDPENPC
jgi:transposase